MSSIRRKNIIIVLLLVLMQCSILHAEDYFRAVDGVSHLPIFADTAAVPASKEGGALVFSTADGRPMIYSGTDWKPAGSLWTISGSDIYYDTGNVGIGTTTPAVNLHVKGAAGADGVIALQEPGGDKIWYIKNQLTSGNLFFSNAGGDKLTILDGGNVGIGVSDPLLKLTIGDNDTGFQWLSDGYFGLYTQSNSVIRVGPSRETYFDGRIYVPSIGSSSWQPDIRIVSTSRELTYDVSDERLKTITGDYTKGLSGLTGIKPKYYYMNNDEAKRVSAGLIAQNVQEFIPEAVGALPDEDGTLFIVDRTLIATAINAIQEQQGQIEELESENTELRGLLEQMDARLSALEN